MATFPPRFFYFYPRPPRGGRQGFRRTVDTLVQFLSTPSARRATRYPITLTSSSWISIHALREEGDISQATQHPDSAAISIHALREEGD